MGRAGEGHGGRRAERAKASERMSPLGPIFSTSHPALWAVWPLAADSQKKKTLPRV